MQILKLTTLVVTLLLFSLQSIAQNKVITGVVTDQEGKGVPGVSVTVKGTTNGTLTDANGAYRINAPENGTLVFSSVGFETFEMPVAGRNAFDATLTSTSGNMSEVVVIGYGTARRKDLTGAVSTVNEKDFNKGTFTSPDQLIQGKVAGLMMVSNNGMPGSATTVKIRGNSAVTGSGQPLYVVDGIPLDGRSARPGLSPSGLGVAPGGNPLNFINPADIASMDILKDASATAIYGSRAAYGVVLITTKRGQSGLPKIDFNASVGVSSIMKRIDVLDASEYRQALTYYGVSTANDKGGNVDALDSILRKGITQNYNISISGGNESGRYRLSFGYLDQEGIVRKTGFKKYTASLGAQFKFLDNKRLGLDISLIPSQYVEDIAPITNDAGSTGSLIGQALQWNPTEPMVYKNLPAVGSLGVRDSINIKAGDIINPYAMSEAYSDRSKVTTVLGSISPFYKFTNSLEYRMLYSLNYSVGNRRASIQQFINLGDVANKGVAYIAQNELITHQVTHTLNFNKQLSSSFSLNALVGFEYMKFINKGSSTFGFGPAAGGFGRYGLDYTNYIQYSDPASRNISSFIDPKSELQSYFARAVMNFKDKYLVTGTFRADGSTKFGENNKYGYFPSFAAAWNLSRESFFKVDFINLLKIRAGWGKVGNQEFPAGSSVRRYSFTNNGGLGLVNNPNEDLKWQSDRQYNIGIDLFVLKNRLSITADYFNKKTTDLLYPTSPIQPAPPGSVVTWKNLEGEIENKGVELSANATIIDKTRLVWDFGVNVTFLKNNASNLAAPIATGALHGQGITGTTVQTIRNGLPINTFFHQEFQGLDKTTGQAIYRDNGTFFVIGDPNPKTLLGISTSLMISKFIISLNMSGAFGQDVYNNTLNNVINVGSINGGRNIATSVFRDPVKESFSNRVTASSRFIEDASYLKMTNASIFYNLGSVGTAFKGASIYVTGQNLFVITDFSGFDPEVNVDKNVNGVPSLGIEYTPYPSSRTITLGVRFSF